MVGLMQRRREMMRAASQPYWDFEWDYTMGKLEEQPGWTSVVNGTASTTLVENGEKFASNNNSTFTVYPVSGGVCDNVRHFTSGYGTMEIVISGKFYKPTNGVNNFRISAPISSDKRLTLIQAGPSSDFKWRVLDNATPKNCTAIAPCADNVKYKVKIVMKDTVADIYINDVLVKANQSTSATIYGNLIQAMHQNGGGSSYYTILESLKIHQGQ